MALRGTGNRTLHPWNRPLNLAQWTDPSFATRTPFLAPRSTVYILQLVFRFRSL